ncbi:MAG: DeoR family transcriptional regulator [Thalassospira sp.]|uniref:DeoR/GlpR family DNA-binding transcription regulator n=1 Tax=Thalassospira sp. GB04J01 TaxID=1485225 RepID=UPI000C10386D|nr:DeoR/GlpR family DNA-binding transcription regulator [Thalassospira sp. GB04J01]MBV16261.1 DeoR family transcriptional regulator [Thalassospira sp.]|tara:strand:- start:13153 stop:13953 length:801 start_codon:yes stop_codon:yes gene_type:complete
MSRKKETRLDRIMGLLETHGFLRLKDAADALDVSEMTVRRDIATCDGRFIFLGGYITPARKTPGGMGYILDRERAAHSDLKQSAGQAAVDLVRPGETVFLDCGTTIPYLASLLPTNNDITVICYSMNVAEIVCKKPGTRVIMLGGLYEVSSASFSGPAALETLRGMAINTAFISAGGVHTQRGISCSNFHEVDIKQLAISKALTKALVVDSTKFDSVKPVLFEQLENFDFVCCDTGVAKIHRQQIERAGVKLRTAETELPDQFDSR